MSDNFVEKYKEEASESSIVDGEEHKEDLSTKPRTAESKPRAVDNIEVVPYTFDPQSVLKATQNPATSNDFEYTSYAQKSTNAGYSPSEPAFASSREFSYGKIKAMDPYASRLSDSLFRKQSDVTTLGNLDECRRTEEYKGFAQDFEKEFASDQREIEQVSKDMVARTKKLQTFGKELESPDLDMILYRSRLIREVAGVENDLHEAYNNIIVLMEDRSKMKDQFCLFKMKVKKLKGFIKTFQDDIQA
eukprot:TRINITY_DN74_c0_g3_i1.p1 TRINITY_DN74_c0_g3~~TRINITY_DN74_c0_g3_i1.p1  ORF type:complete len:247 (+),score=89.03 TRINITY_DN74_c0_g3_i1:236-976(+)